MSNYVDLAVQHENIIFIKEIHAHRSINQLLLSKQRAKERWLEAYNKLDLEDTYQAWLEYTAFNQLINQNPK